MPELMLKCLDSWKTYLPEYEIMLWNEDNFDFHKYQYAVDATKQENLLLWLTYAVYMCSKKWAVCI